MKPGTRVGLLSLGCPRNLVDSESILARLRRKGLKITDIGKAQVAIVNTCAFIEDAKRESIDAILELIALKKEGRIKSIIVHGCLAQRYGETLKKELPEVDAFVGSMSLNHERDRFAITPKHFAYLKICEGCVNNCSYCVIPKIKGRFASLNKEDVLKKVADFSRQWLPELNIIGQDISGYGVDLYGSFCLDKLLEEILRKARNIGWIRLLYLNPNRISDKLLKIIAGSEKMCKYADIPIQHINNRILKAMKRVSTGPKIRDTIGRVRKLVPGVALRTSLIVGFPGETDQEFEELLTFIKEIKFERLGAFTYSREEGTPAYSLGKQIPQNIMIERLNRIMSAQQEIAKEVNSSFLGKTIKVLIDEKEGNSYLGRTQFDAPEVDGLVYVDSKKKLKPGDFVKVNVTDTLEYDLAGRAL